MLRSSVFIYTVTFDSLFQYSLHDSVYLKVLTAIIEARVLPPRGVKRNIAMRFIAAMLHTVYYTYLGTYLARNNRIAFVRTYITCNQIGGLNMPI